MYPSRSGMGDLFTLYGVTPADSVSADRGETVLCHRGGRLIAAQVSGDGTDEVTPIQRHQPAALDGDHRRGARHFVEEGDLAEAIPRPAVVAKGTVDVDLHLPRLDQIEALPLLSLGDDL